MTPGLDAAGGQRGRVRLLARTLRVAALVVLAASLLPVRAQGVEFDADIGLDPGHSYADVGTSGSGLREFELTLDVALRARALLEARGYSVRLTRTDSAPLTAMNDPDPIELVRIEQAARVASVGRVRCFVSIHFNGFDESSLSGTETYYNPDNFGPDSRRLADAVHRGVTAGLQEAGYAPRDRGVKSDLLAGKPYGHLFSLRGPMPSVLVENLFLTNPGDAAALQREEIRQALAEGYSRGISEYLGGATSGLPAPPRSDGEPNSRYFSTMIIASTTMPPDILDLPTRRSTNTIGTSAIR